MGIILLAFYRFSASVERWYWRAGFVGKDGVDSVMGRFLSRFEKGLIFLLLQLFAEC